MPKIYGLFTASKSGVPMEGHSKVTLIAGQGIAGDRYASGMGTYSNRQPPKIRHVTFIAQDAIDKANKELVELGVTFEPIHTRRNILLEGITADELNALVGRHFTAGRVMFRGTELAAPCKWPPLLLKDRWPPAKRPIVAAAFERAFANRGGIRAEVLAGGILTLADPVDLMA